MQYAGVFGNNEKWVEIDFRPGWGEPGEWFLRFSDGRHLTIDNVSAIGNQEQYLSYLSEDKYRDETILNNWAGTGNADDIVRIVLEFIGYDENSRRADEECVEAAKRMIFEAAQKAADDLTYEGLFIPVTPIVPNPQSYITQAQRDSAPCVHRMHAYDALQRGEQVGLCWSNESFLRDFPDSKYVPRVRQLMKEMA